MKKTLRLAAFISLTLPMGGTSVAADLFEVVVDTKDPVEVGIFDGSCKRLADEQKKKR
ncbi:MAG: hypothetical protein ACK5O7_06505 [Holosporales bacterium]